MFNIENQYPENHYLRGESLFENKAIVESHMMEKALWSIIVKDKKSYEVEIKGFRTKKVLSTCECATYKKEKSCPHIIAALLHLRALLPEKLSTPTKPISYNINSIISQLSKEELSKFVKVVAQKDKVFNYKLKAVFINKIDLEDNSKKYGGILQSLVKPVTSTGTKMSAADIRLAVWIIKEFQDQLEDAMALSQFTIVFNVMSGIWGKIHYLYRHYPTTHSQLEQVIQAFNTYVVECYESSLAPTLLEKLDALLVEISLMSYYNYIDPQNEIIYILYKYHRNNPLQVLFSDMKREQYRKLSSEESTIVTALYALISKGSLLPHEITDSQVIAAAKILQDWNEAQFSVSLLEQALKSNKRNRTFEYALISAYYKTEQSKKGEEIAVGLFVKYKEFRFLRKLKDENEGHISKSIASQIASLLNELKTEYRFKATYFRTIDDIDNLLETLSLSSDLQLLMEHDAYLYNRNYVKLEAVYISAIEEYLSSHAGTIAMSFLDEIKAHLQTIKAFKLQSALRTHLGEKFSHRSGVSDFK